jgi:hypothetical protein
MKTPQEIESVTHAYAVASGVYMTAKTKCEKLESEVLIARQELAKAADVLDRTRRAVANLVKGEANEV